MISETEFASRYSSTWRMLAPMTEDFVRYVNGAWYERKFAALRSRHVQPQRRSIVNEVAFQAFALDIFNEQSEEPNFFFDPFSSAIEQVANDERWSAQGRLNTYERQESVILYQRLNQYFRKGHTEGIVILPKFQGCGLIDGCTGDIIVGDALYEIKAGGRFFRSIDLRQLLVYSMLNRRAGTYQVEQLGMFNPRVGICYKASLAEICYEVSGKPADELLSDIAEVVSRADISR